MDSAFLFLGTHQMKTKLILLTSLSLLTVACSRQEPPAVQPQPQIVYQQAPAQQPIIIQQDDDDDF